MKEWHFYDKVYRVWLVFCIGDYDDFIKLLKDSTFKYTDEFDEHCSGMMVRLNHDSTTNGNNAYVIWVKKYELPCLVHELQHLVVDVFDDKGIEIIKQNSEPAAYYIEFWLNEIQRVKKKYPQGRESGQVER